MFDIDDELDVAIACMESDELLDEASKEISYSDVMKLQDLVINTINIPLDESVTDPIGLEAEKLIDIEEDLIFSGGDGDLVDLLMSQDYM